MVRFADGTGPGAFDEEQAKAYAAAIDIETEFPHSIVFSGRQKSLGCQGQLDP